MNKNNYLIIQPTEMKAKIIPFILFCAMRLYSTEYWYSTYSKKAHKKNREIPFDGSDYLIGNNEFTDSDFTLNKTKKFIKKYFQFNIWTDEEIEIIYTAAKLRKISIILFLTKIECESGLLSNYRRLKKDNKRYQQLMRWILGYGMYTSVRLKDGSVWKPNGGFKKQIYGGARCLRYWFDVYRPGMYNSVNLGERKIYSKNAATFSLYKYTPFWGKFSENGTKCAGNEKTKQIFYYYKSLWKCLK